MKTLCDLSTAPQISTAFGGWARKLSIVKIVQTIINGDPVETQFPYNFEGVFQPLKAEQIQQKPEGQRSWSWFMIHWFNGCPTLKTNDKIIYKGQQYKVMDVYNYSENNYMRYDIILDFQPQQQ